MMHLDDQQMAAVTTGASRALVLAGAGSGKTRVLIERIGYLLERENVSPYEIMAFSFTRKASGEIRTRLEDRIGQEAHHCTLGTMHGIALQYIHRFGETIGLKPKNVTVYSQWESDYLLKQIAIEMGIYKKSWNPKKKVIDEAFSKYYAEGIPPEPDHPAHDLFSEFIFRCKQNNALTYGALLTGLGMLVKVLRKHLNIKHILVDEVQDIDPLQWQIIEALWEIFGADLFVVGDIDQSIYEFRGAVPGYLIQHQESFAIYRIENNYRSDANIVMAANHLISHNQQRISKIMKAFEDPQTDIIQVKNTDSAALVTLIKTLQRKSPRAERAVLCRVHGPLIKLSRLLTDAGVDHTYVGKKTALTNSENFRRFHAFLKLIVNPYDNFAFLLIKDFIQIDKMRYDKLRSVAANRGESHFQVYKGVMAGRDFATLCDNGSFKHTVLNIKSIIDAHFYPDDQEHPFPCFDPNEIVDFCLESNHTDVKEYLDWLATYDLQEEIKEGEGLQLMTVHAAKGLEWPSVIIVGANEGIMPSKQAIKSGEIESERRLAYVAWTRAEDQLIITVRPETTSNEKGDRITFAPESRFIRESKI